MIARVLITGLVTLMLAGCATSSSTTLRGTDAGRSTYKAMIIDQTDIEPSTGVSRAARKPQTGKQHKIKKGETLWSISTLHGVDVESLASANSIRRHGSIETGDILIIPRTVSRDKKKRVNYSVRRKTAFIWPVRGGIASSFGSKIDSAVNKGIDIKASEGVKVIAAREGRVVYCDPHLKGFGQTVIIDHMDGFQTVYSYNSAIAVKVGDIVERGHVIASVGSTGRAKVPMLHFEIRKNGAPQNPIFYLSR